MLMVGYRLLSTATTAVETAGRLRTTRPRAPTAARRTGADQCAIHYKGGVAGSDRREGGFAKETEGWHAGSAQSRETARYDVRTPLVEHAEEKKREPPPGFHTRRKRGACRVLWGNMKPPPTGALAAPRAAEAGSDGRGRRARCDGRTRRTRRCSGAGPPQRHEHGSRGRCGVSTWLAASSRRGRQEAASVALLPRRGRTAREHQGQ